MHAASHPLHRKLQNPNLKKEEEEESAVNRRSDRPNGSAKTIKHVSAAHCVVARLREGLVATLRLLELSNPSSGVKKLGQDLSVKIVTPRVVESNAVKPKRFT